MRNTLYRDENLPHTDLPPGPFVIGTIAGTIASRAPNP